MHPLRERLCFVKSPTGPTSIHMIALHGHSGACNGGKAQGGLRTCGVASVQDAPANEAVQGTLFHMVTHRATALPRA